MQQLVLYERYARFFSCFQIIFDDLDYYSAVLYAEHHTIV